MPSCAFHTARAPGATTLLTCAAHHGGRQRKRGAAGAPKTTRVTASSKSRIVVHLTASSGSSSPPRARNSGRCRLRMQPASRPSVPVAHVCLMGRSKRVHGAHTEALSRALSRAPEDRAEGLRQPAVVEPIEPLLKVGVRYREIERVACERHSTGRRVTNASLHSHAPLTC